jgi:hypothetical protein
MLNERVMKSFSWFEANATKWDEEGGRGGTPAVGILPPHPQLFQVDELTQYRYASSSMNPCGFRTLERCQKYWPVQCVS